MSDIPKVGEIYAFRRTVGYVLEQHRPFAHSDGTCPFDRPYMSRCADPKFNGETIVTTAPVERVIFYADNSVEVEGPDGLRSMIVAPHGDLC